MKFIFLFVGVVLFTSCSNVLDKPMSAEHLADVKEKIESEDEYSPMKKKYLISNISTQTGFAVLAQAMDVKKEDMPTFRKQINELSTDFDSIKKAKNSAKESNKLLEGFVLLKDAKTTSMDKYKGYLSMNLTFNNKFNKEVLYVVLNYMYVDKYDTKHFDESAKLTDEVANFFKGEAEVTTTEEYNDVAEFMYTKVPVQASLKVREELGIEEANRKVETDFLMEGLQVSVSRVVFTDKTELLYEDSDWEYFEVEL